MSMSLPILSPVPNTAGCQTKEEMGVSQNLECQTQWRKDNRICEELAEVTVERKGAATFERRLSFLTRILSGIQISLRS